MDIISSLFLQSTVLAQAAPGGGFEPSAMGPIFMIAMFGVVMYFIVLRPQNKREAERRRMLESLEKGSLVVTVGGICGTVVGLTEKHVVLRVDDNVKIEFLRSAISQVADTDDAK